MPPIPVRGPAVVRLGASTHPARRAAARRPSRHLPRALRTAPAPPRTCVILATSITRAALAKLPATPLVWSSPQVSQEQPSWKPSPVLFREARRPRGAWLASDRLDTPESVGPGPARSLVKCSDVRSGHCAREITITVPCEACAVFGDARTRGREARVARKLSFRIDALSPLECSEHI